MRVIILRYKPINISIKKELLCYEIEATLVYSTHCYQQMLNYCASFLCLKFFKRFIKIHFLKQWFTVNGGKALQSFLNINDM